MTILIFDCEVFKEDWLFVFRALNTANYYVFHNDNMGVRDFLAEQDDHILCGFNNKHYDQFILRAVLGGLTPEEIKAVNDAIILDGMNGWDIPILKGINVWFNQTDLMDDTQKGQSLKSIEGHMGMDIRETTVSFDLDRALTEDELQEVIFYCKHDVDATHELYKLRRKYLQTKLDVGRMSDLPDTKSLYMTNAKLTSAFLKAQPPQTPWTDERAYQYPANLQRDFIPQEVFDFFDRMHDMTLTHDEVFKSNLKILVGDCPVTIAYGGIHGALPNFVWEEEKTDSRIIRNYDVGSYYPHLMTINGYTSRNIPNPQIYADMLEKRMQAKKSGDKVTANALKLIANTTYGAMLNGKNGVGFNDLFDPLMARSVCVSGQLYLLELAEHMMQTVPGLRIVQLNTDGIMVEFGKDQYEQVTAIANEWQTRTGFELEEDKIFRIYQKDVNNYIEIPYGPLYNTEGKPRWKIKGGYLVRGTSDVGAWKINNNACIVATAIVNYFVFGDDPEKTVTGCDDITQFQMIAKSGANYKESYYIVDGEKQPVQKVNRVYATSDERYGKLYKVKAEDDSSAKIDSLPEHCIIDNDNHLTIEDVDKSFYIAMARKRINDFIGIREKKVRKPKMAATKAEATPVAAKMNVYQKLAMARLKLSVSGIKKTGKNMKLATKHYRLEDFVPTVLQIFAEIGLISIVSFGTDLATMDIINTDNPEDNITFSTPVPVFGGIETKDGRAVTNPLQDLGSTQSYIRRYLYQTALDIAENDGDGVLSTDEETPAPKPVSAPPATPVQREETKQALTNSDGAASPLQVNQLKKALDKLLKADPSKETMIAEITVQTKKFTEISKKDCETLTIKVGEMLAALEGQTA